MNRKKNINTKGNVDIFLKNREQTSVGLGQNSRRGGGEPQGLLEALNPESEVQGAWAGVGIQVRREQSEDRG